MNFRKPRPHPGAEPESIPVPGIPGLKVPRKVSLPEPPSEPVAVPLPPPIPHLPPPPRVPRDRRSIVPTGLPRWALAVLAIVGALGGAGGIAKIVGAGATQGAEVRPTKDQCEEGLKIERAERVKIQTRITETEEQLKYQAGLLCELNEGRPHSTFPCDGFPKATKPLNAVDSPPTFTTEKPYPQTEGH